MTEQHTARTEAIESLEALLIRIYEVVCNDSSFHEYLQQDYKKYYHEGGIQALYDKTHEETMEHIVHAYSGKRASGYSHTTAENIMLEVRLWTFAEKNPEQWFVMTEHVAYGPNSANIFHIEGFQYMHNFIHNGLRDDWEMRIAQKDNDIVFVNWESQQEKDYKAKGYTLKALDDKSMSAILNKFEPTRPKVNI